MLYKNDFTLISYVNAVRFQSDKNIQFVRWKTSMKEGLSADSNSLTLKKISSYNFEMETSP